MLKAAVLAPMPSASDRTAVAANTGVRLKPLSVYRMSWARRSHHVHSDSSRTFFDHVGRIAEGLEGRPPGVLGRQPVAHVLGCRLVEVEAEVLADLIVEGAP